MMGRPAANKGKPASEETKQRMSKAQKGRKHSEETKQKISESNKGKHTMSENNKQKLILINYGNKKNIR